MNKTLTIRDAKRSDVAGILQLYLHLTANNVPYSLNVAEDSFGRFLAYDGSTILLGESGGEMVSSCALVVIPNLTRGGQPYALIENVVTHADHRRCGYGRLILDAATRRAWECGCYKVMLMTGSDEAGTLAFYERAGFKQSKTGFQKRRP